MFAVAVTFTIDPDHWTEFLRLMRRNAATTLRKEPGCFQFDVALDPERPNEIFLYELYTNKSAFQSHLETAHFVEFDRAVATMITSVDMRTYREVMK